MAMIHLPTAVFLAVAMAIWATGFGLGVLFMKYRRLEELKRDYGASIMKGIEEIGKGLDKNRAEFEQRERELEEEIALERIEWKEERERLRKDSEEQIETVKRLYAEAMRPYDEAEEGKDTKADAASARPE